MGQARILIVEDELITAKAIKVSLIDSGYLVVGVATTGPEAIRLAAEHNPDLILMDIRLKGVSDGIDAAQVIQATLCSPILYLTAYSDNAILARARATLPAGYLLKPFTTDDLRAAIDIALCRHRVTQALEERGELLRSVVCSMGEAVIAVDRDGMVTLLNPTAEQLTGWTQDESLGQPVAQRLVLVKEADRRPVRNPLLRAMQERSLIQLDKKGTLLIARDGTEHPICDSAAPVLGKEGTVNGAVMVFQKAGAPAEA